MLVRRLNVDHLLAPGRFEALEFLHVASVEGVQRVDEPLLVRVPQGLQHGMHELQRHATTRVSAQAALAAALTANQGGSLQSHCDAFRLSSMRRTLVTVFACNLENVVLVVNKVTTMFSQHK